MRFYVALQTPSVELTVTASDSAGQKSTIIIGFKRPNVTEAEKLSEKIRESEGSRETFDSILSDNILYYKNLDLRLPGENGEELKSTIKDTRSIQADHAIFKFIKKDENLVEIITEEYLESAPWRLAIMKAFYSALSNIDEKTLETVTKNL